jgi:starvation-inducible outer membrane lipoprotein
MKLAKMKKVLLFSTIALLFIGCITKSDTLKVNYIR